MRDRVLFLTTRLPWPPDSGGTLVTGRLLRELAREFDVDVWCLHREPGLPATIEDIARVLGGVRLRLFPCKDRRRSTVNLAISILHGVPLNVYRNLHAGFAREVRTRASGYSILIADHYEMCHYVPRGYSGRVLFVEHNIESDLWRRYASLPVGPHLRAVARFESSRIRAYERGAIRRAAAVVCLSADDARRAAALAGNDVRHVHHVPVVGDTDLLQCPAPEYAATKPIVLFVGTLTWEPNVDGLCEFIETAWDAVRSALPEAQLRIVGRSPHPRLQTIAQRHEGVLLTGYRESLNEEYAVARAVAVPLRFGGGVKVKVVNAMMRGLPVVSTPVGMEGIAGAEEYGGAARTIADMAGVLIRLMKDGAFWTHLSITGRMLAERRFGDAAVRESLLRVLRSARV